MPEEKQSFVAYEFGGIKPNKCLVAVIVGIIVALIFATMVVVVAVVALTRSSKEGLEIQGHRGCRGLMPENTIPAFIKAVELGVQTIQMDLVISKDSQVVASFLPYLHPEICKNAQGQAIASVLEGQTKYNLYNMTAAEIAQCDCGLLGNPLFPTQEKVKASKPLLNEVIDTVERYVQLKSLSPVYYNVEMRSKVATDNLFHPVPATFARHVYNVLRGKKILQKSIVQSEDVRCLKEIRALDSSIALALAIREPNANETSFVQSKLDALGFLPKYVMIDTIYMSSEVAQFTQARGILLFSFPASSQADMFESQNKGANGIITDFPDVALKLKKDSQL